MIGRAPGADEDWLWEAEPGTQDVYPLRQIIFDHPLAGRHAIAIFDWIRGRPELLREELDERHLSGATPVRALATREEIPWIEELLRDAGHQMATDWITTEFPPQRIQLVVNVRMTDAYLRAVAKIVFHYTLKMFPDLTGEEPEFAAVKEFIWSGGGRSNGAAAGPAVRREFSPRLQADQVDAHPRGGADLRPDRGVRSVLCRAPPHAFGISGEDRARLLPHHPAAGNALTPVRDSRISARARVRGRDGGRATSPAHPSPVALTPARPRGAGSLTVYGGSG